MGLFNFTKKDRQEQDQTPKQPGNPMTMVLFRLLAIGYALWMLKDFVAAYLSGAEDAPSLVAVIIVSIVFLALCGWIGYMTFKQYKQMQKELYEYNEEMARQAAEEERLEAEKKALEEEYPEDGEYFEAEEAEEETE